MVLPPSIGKAPEYAHTDEAVANDLTVLHKVIT